MNSRKRPYEQNGSKGSSEISRWSHTDWGAVDSRTSEKTDPPSRAPETPMPETANEDVRASDAY